MRDILSRRGGSAADIEAVLPVVSNLTPFSPEEILDRVFQPCPDRSLPYPEGRFGDGTFAVYYSALEEDTCKAEIVYHLRKELNEESDARTYQIIACRYMGCTVNLLGKACRQHPDLASDTEAGYPYCQRLAREAVRRGRDGFLTASARNPDGTCVPVFRRPALSEPRAGTRFLLTVEDGQVQFRVAESGT